MTRSPLTLACALVLTAACSADGGGSIYDSDSNSATMTVGNTNTDPDRGSEEDTGTSTTDEIKLDVAGDDMGMATAGDGGDGLGCQKVDFLFVIDNSGSMLEEQDNLAASFPSFINSISSTLDEAQDYHVMVVDVDEWVWAGCDVLCLFPIPIPACVGYECNVTQPMECEDVLGAGVTFPRGLNASNQDCNFVGGARYMTDAEPNLAGAFQCAARVGTDSQNDPERPMDAMMAAVSSQGPAAACNAGFLRDDAILVVTFITDEDDDAGDGSSGDVNGWHQALVDAKGGNEDAIVVLGLFGEGGCAESSPRLSSFVDSWGDKGFFGSICAPDYDDFFQAAVDIIDTTCDEFTPPE